MRSPRNGMAALIVVVAAIGVAGCAGTDQAPAHPGGTARSTPSPDPASGDGPLSRGDVRGEVCIPLPTDGHDVAWGLHILRNTGDEEATITGISVVDGKGLRLADSVVVDIPLGKDLLGVSSRWPPRWINQPTQAALWRGRQPAIRYRVPPENEVVHNLVAHIVRDPGVVEASMQALRIDYTVGSRSYWFDTNTRLVLKPRCP